MKLRDFLKTLETLPGHDPEPTPVQEVTEAAAELLDVVLPSIEALGGIRKQLVDIGLPEHQIDQYMGGLIAKIVEGM